MGVLNATPDSFSDGGRFDTGAQAEARIEALLQQGADILDIGAESTRPGSQAVDAQQQIDRAKPAVAHAVSLGAGVSIDTTDPEVADHMLSLGARIVNDVSCGANPELAHVTASHGASLVLMHSRAPQSDMSGFSEWPDDDYDDVTAEVSAELRIAADRAINAGVSPNDIAIDPGFGFSKNARHCFEILARLRELRNLGYALLVGPGRKSFIASVDPSGPGERLGGTIAAWLVAAERGAAIVRVHDVREVRQALAVIDRTGAVRTSGVRTSAVRTSAVHTGAEDIGTGSASKPPEVPDA